MNPKTGEVKAFDPDEGIPKGWRPMPAVGEFVDVHYKVRLKGGVNATRKCRGRVSAVKTGNPGTLVVEMLPDRRK